MYPPYHDIRGRLGEPAWHDWHGVPRYQPYEPGLQDVYADYDALLLVRCQGCSRQFEVGACAQRFGVRPDGEVAEAELPDEFSTGDFGYGDAPWHEDGSGMCAGVTMSAVPVAVIEFWTRDGFDWRRQPERERAFRWPEK